MTGQELEARLSRMEGLLQMVANDLSAMRRERDIYDEISKSYKRGYEVGRHARNRNKPLDPEGALARARGPYKQREKTL